MNPHKVEALRKALDELGEYTRKLKQAEENLRRAARRRHRGRRGHRGGARPTRPAGRLTRRTCP
jgi:hypothetical protein